MKAKFRMKIALPLECQGKIQLNTFQRSVNSVANTYPLHIVSLKLSIIFRTNFSALCTLLQPPELED